MDLRLAGFILTRILRIFHIAQGLTSSKETIRLVLLHAHLEVLHCAISKIRKIRVQRNTNQITSHLEVLPRAIRKIRKIRGKINTANRSATR